MQLGFVIDHTRCIGCHACTVACKSENQVPLGSFRTWVKYTEQGEFPAVKRSFAVLRCNQCSNAPCVTICPVSALEKRGDGIVDLDQDACIGCKACMHGCPYDALYINEDTGTAEKCHFCAHRTERGLAPACAIVCPTEAIIPGDFHDPQSRVSMLTKQHSLSGRKLEAGTKPNVLYREVDRAGIDPAVTNLSQGFIWSQPPEGPLAEAQRFEQTQPATQEAQTARTVYDVPRKPLWGDKIVGYLFFKAVAAGLFPIGFLLLANSDRLGPWQRAAIPAVSLAFIGITCALLVADLKRPERFLKILLRPNWNSWLARGTFIIAIYSLMLVSWTFVAIADKLPDVSHDPFFWMTATLGGLTAAYTGWLFGQARGRVLWMRRGSALHLLVKAAVAGSAALCLAGLVPARGVLLASLGLHAAFVLAEDLLAPKKREAEYARASALVKHGPYSKTHWRLGFQLGILVPAVLLGFSFAGIAAPLAVAAGLSALIGLYFEERTWVQAGQALPIS